MTNLPIPIQVLYAGLAGTVLALIVATAMNRWSLRVFFLLALRLAIGWHFLYEGLYKVNSKLIGPTETNRHFTSEPYFRNAPAHRCVRQAVRRSERGDRGSRNPREINPAAFDQLVPRIRRRLPAPWRRADKLEPTLAAVKAEVAKELAKAGRRSKGDRGKSDSDKQKAKETTEKRGTPHAKDENAEQIARERIIAKAASAWWVFGLPRPGT